MSHYNVTVNGVTYAVTLLKRSGEEISFSVDGQSYNVSITRPQIEKKLTKGGFLPGPQAPSSLSTENSVASPSASPGEVRAPIPGILSSVKVSVGDTVTTGDTVAIIEAMKMENPIRAHTTGRVTEIFGTAGDEVKVGSLLVRIENLE